MLFPSAPIPAGKQISFVIQGRCVGLLTTLAGDVRQEVSDALAARGWTVYSLVVRALTSERWGDWDYRAEARLSSPAQHANIEDVISVVRGTFWEATGSLPTVSALGYTTQGEQPTPSTLIPDLSGFAGWVKGLSAGAVLALVGVGILIFYKRV